MSEFRTWLKSHREAICASIFALLFAFQIANVCTYLSRNTHPQAINAAVDDDSAWIVKRALATRWYKDNGTAVYGPAYFRLLHSLQYFLGDTAAPEGARSQDAWQRTVQYIALVVSLFAMAASSFLIAFLISSLWSVRFLVASALLSAFLANEVWTDYLLRAHPDHLFAFVCLVAFVFTYLMLREPHRRLWFVASAVTWGLTVSVKLSTVIWGPVFLFLFLPPFNKANFLRLSRFFGWMLLSYFVVGFPQTIVIDRPIKVLLRLGSFDQPTTWASFQHWLDLLGSQMFGPMAVLILAILFFGERRWAGLSKINTLRLVAFCLWPFALLVFKNMTIPTDHYPIPFVIVTMALLVLLGWRVAWLQRLPYFLKIAIIPLLIFLTWGYTPAVLNKVLSSQTQCRPESYDAYAEVQKYFPSHKFMFDPFFPSDSWNRKSRNKVEWFKTWPMAIDADVTAFGLRRDYMNWYLKDPEKNPWVQKTVANWPVQVDFYKAFAEGDRAKAPNGKTFKRVYKNVCGHEIWLREDNASGEQL